MKRIIFVLIVILIGNSALAGWFGGDDDKKEPPKKSVCYYSLQIADEVYYIYRGGCDRFLQVGIINGKQVMILNGSLKIISKTEFNGESVRQKFIDNTWPDLRGVKFYEKSSSAIE